MSDEPRADARDVPREFGRCQGWVWALADGDRERAALVAYHIAMMSDGLAAERSRPPLPFHPAPSPISPSGLSIAQAP
jgi:hypothetical protein